MFIRPVPVEEQTQVVADMYSEDRATWGFLPEFTEVFSHHPEAYAAWKQMIGAVRSGLDRRRFELVTLAAARTLRSNYCSTAHGKVLAERFYDPDTVRALVVDHHSAGLDELDVALMDFAAKSASDATSVTAKDVERLRHLGLTERDILDVVLAVAARCFFATVVETLAAGPDPEMQAALPQELRDALLVARQRS